MPRNSLGNRRRCLRARTSTVVPDAERKTERILDPGTRTCSKPSYAFRIGILAGTDIKYRTLVPQTKDCKE